MTPAPDYVLRLEFLRVLRLLHSVKLEAIAEIEEFIERLDNLKQYNLSGERLSLDRADTQRYSTSLWAKPSSL
jgi:hypothetical protein